MKRKLLVGALVAACLALTACSPGLSYGVRLNGDDTVDFANCFGEQDVRVDYRVGDEYGPVEWTLVPEDDEEPFVGRTVIKYGHLPAGFTGDAAEPPVDWTEVVVGSGHVVERSELEAGEWLWVDSNFAWIPGEPCLDTY